MTSKVLPHLPESIGGGQGGQPWEWAQEFSMNLFFLQIKVLLLRPCRSVVTSPTFAASSPHCSLCCWQSHMVTSHLPEGPLPWALPGPEGAVQGFHLCAGCRTGGTRRISPTPSWVAWGGGSAPSDCKMSQVQCPFLPCRGQTVLAPGQPDRASGPH